MSSCYVYVLYRPWNGVPCYVGKGNGKRCLWHATLNAKHPNKHLANIFKKAARLKLQVQMVKIKENLSDTNAIELEIALIKSLGRKDLGKGPLVNHTDGGDGAAGAIRSPAYIEAQRRRTKRMMANPIIRAKVIAGLKLNASNLEWRKQHSEILKNSEKAKKQREQMFKDPKFRAKVSKRMKKTMSDPSVRAARVAVMRTPKAIKNHKKAMADPIVQDKLNKFRIGKILSEKTLRLMRKAHIGKTHSEKTLAKMRKAQRERRKKELVFNPECRAKQAAKLKGRPFSPKHIANICKAQKKRRERERAKTHTLLA